MIGCLDVFQVQLEFLPVMFDDMMFDDMLYPAIMQGPEFSSEMQCYFSRLLVLFLATVLQQFTVTVGLCQSLSVRSPSITQMQHRMPVARASAQAMGLTCRNCNNIFDSRRSMECHRRHVTTPAATNHYRSLDVQTCLLESFANMQGPSVCSPTAALGASCALSYNYFWCSPGEIL